MLNAWCFGGCFLNHPEATTAYSGLRKGGKHSGNSCLIKQFWIDLCWGKAAGVSYFAIMVYLINPLKGTCGLCLVVMINNFVIYNVIKSFVQVCIPRNRTMGSRNNACIGV